MMNRRAAKNESGSRSRREVHRGPRVVRRIVESRRSPWTPPSRRGPRALRDTVSVLSPNGEGSLRTSSRESKKLAPASPKGKMKP